MQGAIIKIYCIKIKDNVITLSAIIGLNFISYYNKILFVFLKNLFHVLHSYYEAIKSRNLCFLIIIIHEYQIKIQLHININCHDYVRFLLFNF